MNTRIKMRTLGLVLLFAGLACGRMPPSTIAELPAQTATPPQVTESTPTLAVAAPPASPTSMPSPSPNAPTLPAPPAPQGDVYAVVNVEGHDTLNVRTGAGVANAVVTALPPYAMNIQITGPAQQTGGAPWVPILYGSQAGWVNKNYLALQLGSIDASIASRMVDLIHTIRKFDFAAVATFVHPDKGLRFSPYAYTSPQDLIFSAAQVSALPTDLTTYLWGAYDGSGMPIQLTFSDYFSEFIYDVEFVQPEIIGFNTVVGTGNTINNIANFYPNAVFVEYHFTGFDPAYGGMDWRSLRLVLEEKNGIWYLVGIIHDAWTI